MKPVRFNNYFPVYNNLLDDFFSKELFNFSRSNYCPEGSTLPSVNISETADNFTIELAAPGFKKDDFKIKLENQLLEISVEQKEEKVEEKQNYTRREFSFGSFKRTFNVPNEVIDTDKIDASYDDGILSIKLAKREEIKPKPSRIINIA